MCDARPGVRCSDYATSTLKITKNRLNRVRNELAAYEEKYAESLSNTENPTKRDLIRQNKHERLTESVKNHEEIVDASEFEYNACPVGQAELREDLQKAIEEENVPLQEELQARIAAGEEYRATARQNLRDIEKEEKENGPEAAEQMIWQKYEEASEVEADAALNQAKSQAELDAARAEAEEYERAMEEYRANDRIDTPEEEAEKARKKKMQLILIGVLAASVLAYSLTRQAATGEKSSLLRSGQSMMMRQAMTAGRQYVMPLLHNGKKEEDARELRAEKEAEQRAAIARERVLNQHAQEEAKAKLNEERTQQRAQQRQEREEEMKQRTELRNQERLADLEHRKAVREQEIIHRNALREEERAAERERRAAEIEHYNKLAEKFKDLPLTPEMQAHVDSKKPKKYNRANTRPTGTNPNRSENISTRQRVSSPAAANAN